MCQQTRLGLSLNDGSGRWKAHGPTPETVLPRVPLNHAANIHVADPSAGQESIVHAEELDIGRFDSDYYALQLGNAILGGNSAANRLYHDLRQITGLHVCAKSIYAVDSFWILHCHDEADVCSVTPANKGRFLKM